MIDIENDDFILRKLSIEDAEIFQKFLHQSSFESTHTLQYQERVIPVEILAEKIKQTFEKPSDISLGLFYHNNLIAHIYMRVSSPDHPWIKHVGEFALIVLKEYWGRGIGNFLIKRMETFAQSVGICRIEGRVRVKNDRGLALYTKCGYSIEGTRMKAALIDGKFEGEYYIAKILN